ncbi:MAG: hypothetical protein VCE74_07290 [Alphaproteobacteria bacterium]
MQLGAGNITGAARPCDALAAPHHIADPHVQALIMAIGRDPAAPVAQQQQIAETAQLVARIDHHAVVRRPHHRTFPDRDIDAVVVQAIGLGPEAGDHPPFNRPGETPPGAFRGRLDNRFQGLAAAWLRRRIGGASYGKLRLAGRQTQLLPWPDFVGGRHPIGSGQGVRRYGIAPGNTIQSLSRRHAVIAHAGYGQALSLVQAIGRAQFIGLDQVTQGYAGAPGHRIQGFIRRHHMDTGVNRGGRRLRLGRGGR